MTLTIYLCPLVVREALTHATHMPCSSQIEQRSPPAPLPYLDF